LEIGLDRTALACRVAALEQHQHPRAGLGDVLLQQGELLVQFFEFRLVLLAFEFFPVRIPARAQRRLLDGFRKVWILQVEALQWVGQGRFLHGCHEHDMKACIMPRPASRSSARPAL
jgi:hypothetical protein